MYETVVILGIMMAISEVRKILKSMRKHNRRAVILPAELSVDGQKIKCTAYDVSLGGVRLKIDMPLIENSQVIVKTKDKLSEVPRVVWSAEGFVGLNSAASPTAVKAGLGGLAADLN